MNLHPGPFEPFGFEGRDFFVKRDDLIHPLLSGNKYRKLYSLIHTPSRQIDTVVSFGGIQSNAMLSIAALCDFKGWRFEYTAKTVPEHLRNDPQGNYRQALELGMRLNEVRPAEYDDAVQMLLCGRARDAKRIVVPQGGADPSAQEGIAILAEEIMHWQQQMKFDALIVATPSGTGTTAAYLAQSLPDCRVVTAPAVGDGAYLIRQIEHLMAMPPNLTVLSTSKPYRFGHPDAALLQKYRALKRSGIEFDLIYAPVMWTALMENIAALKGPVLYVHSGGVSGNTSMLARYARMESLRCDGAQAP